MLALTLLVASIAVADSINPSTVLPALWLASTPRGHLVSFTLGVFVVYLTGGLVLLLGPGPALISALRHMHGTVEHAIEAAAGAAVLALAVGLWRARRSPGSVRLPRPGRSRRSAFMLGAGIMAVELPTAFVYFGVISAVLAAHQVESAKVALIIGYNVLFVAPLAGVLAIRRLAGERAQRWLARGSERLIGFGQLLLAGVTGAAGAVLVTIGVAGLLAA
ncbi:MAG: GAP family protein [Actinomycetota bacterium]|nr:GAP family protein [Actinomycetota bacterium]